jgi:Flp pilus assembly protein TadG
MHRRTTGTTRAYRKPRSGQALVETVLLIPLLTLLVMGMVDFGRVYYFAANVNNAAREGARVAILNIYTGPQTPSCASSPYTACPVQTDVAITNAVNSELTGTGIGPITVRACPPYSSADPSCPTSDTRVANYNAAVNAYNVTVRATYSFQLLTPLMGNLLGNPVTFTATAVMRSNY